MASSLGTPSVSIEELIPHRLQCLQALLGLGVEATGAAAVVKQELVVAVVSPLLAVQLTSWSSFRPAIG